MGSETGGRDVGRGRKGLVAGEECGDVEDRPTQKRPREVLFTYTQELWGKLERKRQERAGDSSLPLSLSGSPTEANTTRRHATTTRIKTF